MKRTFLALVSVVALSGCGEPLLVVGDLPGFMRIVAGVPRLPGEQIDTLATVARLTTPVGVTVLDDGKLIVADGARRSMAVAPNGRFELLFRGPSCFDKTCLTSPQGMTLAGQALLIADNGADRIWRFDLQSRSLTSVAGTGQHGNTPDGTQASQAALASPGDVVVLDDGRIVFTERAGHRIRVIAADGALQTLAGTGVGGYSGDGGAARAAQLSGPTGLARRANTLYFTDHGNNVVRSIDLQSGLIQTVAGTGTAGFSGDNGPALEAKLNQPWAADLSPDGSTLLFSDIGNNRVRALNLSSGLLFTFAGNGSTAYNGNGLSAAETALDSPYGLSVAPQGFLFIADSQHHIVWRTPLRVP